MCIRLFLLWQFLPFASQLTQWTDTSILFSSFRIFRTRSQSLLVSCRTFSIYCTVVSDVVWELKVNRLKCVHSYWLIGVNLSIEHFYRGKGRGRSFLVLLNPVGTLNKTLIWYHCCQQVNCIPAADSPNWVHCIGVVLWNFNVTWGVIITDVCVTASGKRQRYFPVLPVVWAWGKNYPQSKKGT